MLIQNKNQISCMQEGDQDNREESIESPKPQVLWSLYLNLPASDIKLEESTPSNLHLCSGPDLELDFDFAVNQVNFLSNCNFVLAQLSF